MTFTAQLDTMVSTLRTARTRLLAPLDFSQQQLPHDPEIFVENVLLYVMDEWSADLKAQGHVLEEDTEWSDAASHYPRFVLRMAGGNSAQLHFTGRYPEALFLTVSKGFRNNTQFSDAKHATVELPITNDPNVLMISLMDGLKGITVQ
ncbi:MAG: hypothetical protein KBA60_03095 [Flavobacteriales bacterium]|nr:hypothetical protein [Flavobacteriales bacterium]MBP6643659.1 hypothetical protein [Flavobacteriales bacterium]MBP7154970.1 hypothetical protein [Flavobacteriales bacterium]HQV74470.1 hypothetical protein [Flavobacteriales bacterium]HQW40016.1 hypothetical protein [Flavobacteriales bacterium]